LTLLFFKKQSISKIHLSDCMEGNIWI